MKIVKAWTRIAVISSAILLLVACGGGGGGYSGGGGGGGSTNVTVPNVVGMTQAAASTSITGAGLTVGTVTMASSNSVASGDVISQTPAASTSVASGSAVALTVSSGPAPVAVPNVVNQTQAAATTALTAAGLKVGTLTMAASNGVAAGNVISQNPAAGANVAPGSAVNLTVSTGPAQVAVPNVVGQPQAAASTAITNAGLKVGTMTMASCAQPVGDVCSTNPAAGTMVNPDSAVNLTVSAANHFAYVSQGGDSSLWGYSVDPASGAMTALPAPFPMILKGSLSELKIDPSHQFLYVVSQGAATDAVYAFVINSNDGTLTAVSGSSPISAGNSPVSLAFDASGKFLFVLNMGNNGSGHPSISRYSVNTSTGALTLLGATNITNGHAPTQLARAGGYLYVTLPGANGIDLLTINPDGSLTEGATPYASDTGPYSVAVDAAGTVLYTANGGTGNAGSVSAFTISAADGSLTAFCTPTPCVSAIAIPANNDIGIDPAGKYLFVTEGSANGALGVYPIDTSSATGLDAQVAGSPFAAGNTPNSVGFDPLGQFVYAPNNGSMNVSQFKLNSTNPVLTAIGSPAGAGSGPNFIAVY
jgi:beta-lactam-binding protein with PASTA domain